jgi:hypothetical protein
MLHPKKSQQSEGAIGSRRWSLKVGEGQKISLLHLAEVRMPEQIENPGCGDRQISLRAESGEMLDLRSDYPRQLE